MHLLSTISNTIRHQLMVLQTQTVKDQVNTYLRILTLTNPYKSYPDNFKKYQIAKNYHNFSIQSKYHKLLGRNTCSSYNAIDVLYI